MIGQLSSIDYVAARVGREKPDRANAPDAGRVIRRGFVLFAVSLSVTGD